MEDSVGLWIVLIIVYFIPWIVAKANAHKNSDAIAVTNLFFGWTGIGWAIALIWAVKK